MLERIIALTLKQRSFVLLAVAIITAFGIYSYLTIPIDAFPDVSNVQVEILSNAPGLSALEIERFVTFPIEMFRPWIFSRINLWLVMQAHSMCGSIGRG